MKYVHLYLSCMNMTKYVNRNELLYCIQLIRIDIGFCRSWPREKSGCGERSKFSN
jgi:hypothetical protein